MKLKNDHNLKITADGRAAMRAAMMAKGDAWHALRREKGYSFAAMSKSDFFDACDVLGIDVEYVVSATASSAADAAEDAAERFKAERRRRAVEAVSDQVVTQPIVTTNYPIHIDGEEVMPEPKKEPRRYQDETHAEAAQRARAASEAFAEVETVETRSAPSPVDGDAAQRLFSAIAEIAGKSMNPADVRALVKAEFESLARDNPLMATRIELTRDNVKVGEVDGHQHAEFAKLLRAATARDANGFPVNIWIAGPAGSGKTHAVGMVAKALDIPFRFNGAIGMPHELLGFTDAGGNYHTTPFRQAYEDGGCYLFDEVDGSDNSALLALNAALANGIATFPDEAIGRNKNCHVFAAANTWGHGATAEYVGRSKIDAAFLSRFPVRISWGYDNALEANMCGNAQFAHRVQNARMAAQVCGLKVLITPRDSIAGAALIAAGFTSDEAAGMTYLASLSDDQRRMIGA